MKPALRNAALAIAAAASLGAGGTCSAPTAAPPITVTDRTLVLSERITRTEFDYVYEVTLVNTGGPATDVRAVASSSAPGTTVVDKEVLVAALAGGDSVRPTDTIRIRQDRTFPFDPKQLVWTITATAANRPPNAAPGLSQSVFVGDPVQLDGSASSDPDGDPLSYAWSLAQRPPGSAAVLAGATSAQPSFTPDLAGDYEITLQVSDGTAASAIASVYVTALESNANPPVVVDLFPAPFEAQVAVDASIVATFTEEIDPATPTVLNFRLTGPNGFVPASVTTSGRSVVLTPDQPLDPGALHLALIAGGRFADLQGQLLADPVEWEFTTRASTQPPTDTTPPQVVSVTPANGATGVIPTRSGAIEVEFSEPVDPGSVIASFSVLRVKGGAIPGAVSMVDTTRARFTPQGAPAAFENQHWSASVSTGVRDLAGNSLPQSFGWVFDTLPSHSPAWLSRFGVGSAGETDAYYASLPIQSDCTWVGNIVDDSWENCQTHGAPTLFFDWLWDLGWTRSEWRAVFYNPNDLAVGRDLKCFEPRAPEALPGRPAINGAMSSPNRIGGARQVACYVENHGPIPGSPGHPDPASALADAASGSSVKSISAIFSKYDQPLDSGSGFVDENFGTGSVHPELFPGDVVTVGPASGSIAPGNLFWASSGPAGVGVQCSSNAVDPQPCPIEGGPLYGLLIDTPRARLDTGAEISGLRALGASRLSFKMLERGHVRFRINDTAPGNGSGYYTVPYVVARANAVSFAVYVPDGTGEYRLARTANLDGEGPKQVPQACIACHGGTWDAETATVTGASLLPIDAARVVMPAAAPLRRVDQDWSIYHVNDLVRLSQSNRLAPYSLIREWVQGTHLDPYVPNDSFTPAGWTSDSALYHGVVKPYCQSCHQALRANLDFSTSAQFRALAPAIQTDVCVTRSMPHAGPTFEQFWQNNAAAILSQAMFAGARCGP
jgi:hypothetical protein